MNFEAFQNSLQQDSPPGEFGPALAGLWWDAKGDWNRAHESAQLDKGPAGAWVHAYLHRKEGDLANAGYWYGRAGKPEASASLEEEWKETVIALLGHTT